MLRIDDIPQQVADGMQGYALICLQKCGIIALKGVILWQKTTC